MTDSVAAVEKARALLRTPERPARPWLAAAAAVLMAGVMVLGPGVRFEDPPAALAG